MLNRTTTRVAPRELRQGGLRVGTSKMTVTMVAALLALSAAACGGGNPADTSPSGGGGGGGGDEIQVGIAYDVGGRGDQSFNDAAYRGLTDAIDDGLVPEENTEEI